MSTYKTKKSKRNSFSSSIEFLIIFGYLIYHLPIKLETGEYLTLPHLIPKGRLIEN